jgi:hypothetical protein
VPLTSLKKRNYWGLNSELYPYFLDRLLEPALFAFGDRISLLPRLAWATVFLFLRLPVIAEETGMHYHAQFFPSSRW